MRPTWLHSLSGTILFIANAHGHPFSLRFGRPIASSVLAGVGCSKLISMDYFFNEGSFHRQAGQFVEEILDCSIYHKPKKRF